VSKNTILDLEKYMFPCVSKKLFGVECLGCGSQRALVLVCKGNFIEAFEMYPAIYTTILFFAFLGLHFFDKTRNYSKTIIGLAIANMIIMIVAYFYKMSF
jgi:Protein of unknown function (DUF2752)